MNIALDALDNKAASVFDGYLVRKDLVRRYSRQYPVPTYVVEFLLGRYCASTDEKEIAEGLEIVEKQLKDRTVRTGDQEIFKARARDTGPVKLIGADPDLTGAPPTALTNRALAIENDYDYAFVPGTGHLLQIEKPAECTRIVEQFLSDCRIGR